MKNATQKVIKAAFALSLTINLVGCGMEEGKKEKECNDINNPECKPKWTPAEETDTDKQRKADKELFDKKTLEIDTVAKKYKNDSGVRLINDVAYPELSYASMSDIINKDLPFSKIIEEVKSDYGITYTWSYFVSEIGNNDKASEPKKTPLTFGEISTIVQSYNKTKQSFNSWLGTGKNVKALNEMKYCFQLSSSEKDINKGNVVTFCATVTVAKAPDYMDPMYNPNP